MPLTENWVFPIDTPLILHLDKYGKIWEKAFFLLNWSLIQSRSETACYWFVQCVKNEPMGWQQSCMSWWWRSPPEPARMGGAIWLYKRPFHHRIVRFFLLLQRLLCLAVNTPHSWTQQPWSARLIHHLFLAPQHRSSYDPVRCRHTAIYTLSKRAGVVATATLLLWLVLVSPACRWQQQRVCFLPGEIPCGRCTRWIWLFSLREHQSHLSALMDSFLFRKRLRPSRPLVFFLLGTCEGKKQWGRGSQCPTESELTSAQIPRALFLPHREVSPVLFSQTCNSFTVTFFPSSS